VDCGETISTDVTTWGPLKQRFKTRSQTRIRLSLHLDAEVLDLECQQAGMQGVCEASLSADCSGM
jgi:hypothetical protein